MTNLTNTSGWFTRINYWDGDTLDRNHNNEAVARAAAIEGSRNLRADVDVCHGATVVETYRAGKPVPSPAADAEGRG